MTRTRGPIAGDATPASRGFGSLTSRLEPTHGGGPSLGSTPMAKGTRRGGRTTPKKQTVAATGRYTPPTPKSKKVSPKWVPIVMFGCLGLGVLIILANYVGLMPGGDAS